MDYADKRSVLFYSEYIINWYDLSTIIRQWCANETMYRNQWSNHDPLFTMRKDL